MCTCGLSVRTNAKKVYLEIHRQFVGYYNNPTSFVRHQDLCPLSASLTHSEAELTRVLASAVQAYPFYPHYYRGDRTEA